MYFSSTKGRLIVLCIEHKQNSDSGSMTFCSKAGSSSQRTSPFREIVGYAAEQLSSSSLCSSPDDNSSDGVKLEETEAWNLRLSYSTIWPGMVVAICPYLDHYFLASSGNSVSCWCPCLLKLTVDLTYVDISPLEIIIYGLFTFSVLCLWFSKWRSSTCEEMGCWQNTFYDHDADCSLY